LGSKCGQMLTAWFLIEQLLAITVGMASPLGSLAVRADRATRFRGYLATVAATDFTRPVDVLENGTNPVQECIYTVFEEEFWHNRYALRDLAELEAAT